MNINRNKLVALSAGLLLVSLTQKCYCTANNCSDSIMVFLIGWLGLAFSGAAITWLANPLLILSWFMTRRQSKYALPVSTLALLFCLLFLLFPSVADNENGGNNTITEYRLGYWLWLLSAATMTIGNFILRLAANTRQPATTRVPYS